MLRAPSFAILAILATTQLATLAAGESIDSPVYKSWAGHPVGTSITHVSVTEARGKTLETITRYKLLDLTKDKAVVETSTISDATGAKVESAPSRREIKREFFLLPGVKKESVGKPAGILKEGEETIRVADRDFKARWYDTKGRVEVGETFTRTWYSDEVPQKILKSETRVPAGGLTTTVTLTEIKTPGSR